MGGRYICDILSVCTILESLGRAWKERSFQAQKCIIMETGSLSWLLRCDGEGHLIAAAGG
jgi:hypothetical protein